jgi:exopolysaccharide biosynthesis polyprenyl glycosylphosphotransferase
VNFLRYGSERLALISQSEIEVLPKPVRNVEIGRPLQFLARPWFKRSLFLIFDMLALALAHELAGILTMAFFHIPRETAGPGYYWLFAIPFFAAVLYLLDGYGGIDLRRPERELELSFKAVSISFVALLAATVIVFKGASISRYFLVLWYACALVCLPVSRWSVRSIYARLWKNGIGQMRALVIGASDRILQYQQLLSLQHHGLYHIVGVIPYQESGRESMIEAEFPVLGELDDWKDAVQRQNIDLVVLNLPISETSHRVVSQIVNECQTLSIAVDVFADIFNQNELNHEFNYFTGCVRLSSKPQWSRAIQLVLKKCLDICFGIMGSVVALLMTPMVTLLVKLEDPGPVFHRRQFVTCDGNIGYYLKFRTMICDADQRLQTDSALRERFMGNYKLRDDPRVLRIGRFLRKYSIDEFPQFFSLLTGQLTLVGPRVIAQDEKERYGDFLSKRLSVKPGITGYWQVMGRQTTTYTDRVQMDMFYIDHWSIWLDILIIMKTFGKLLLPEGAY